MTTAKTLYLFRKAIQHMPVTSNGHIKNNTVNGICTIEFFHPQSNSLPASLLKDIAEAINIAAADNNVRVVVLQSAGENTFCAGASFNELSAITTEQEGLAFFSGFAHVINAMRKCPKLIIGRIQGKCAGGGVGIAAACDYAIASTRAAVKLSELAIGIGPFVVGPAVERKIGNAAFTQLAIDAANWRSSEWACEKGLFASVHADDAGLDEAVHVLAGKLAASSPEAMAAIKKICWQGTDDWDDLLMQRAAVSGRLVLSSFTRNAIQAFKAKK